MILAYEKIGLDIEISEETVNVIYVETPEILCDMITDLKDDLYEGTNNFVLSDGEKEISIHKEAEIVVDPWSIDLDSRRIKNKLYGLLTDVANDYYFDLFLQLKSEMFRYIEGLTEHEPYPLTYNLSFDNEELFKALNIRIEPGMSSFAERLVEYMKILNSLCAVKVFFLVNIKSYLGTELLEMIYKEANLCKLHLVLIESIQRKIINDEKITIIDKDRCIIQI